jgi:hypothetical protein
MSKIWGLPSELRIELQSFLQELEKFEEKEVNSWNPDKKVTYFQEKMDVLRKIFK